LDLTALTNTRILIYGANGYTGRLTARAFLGRGVRTILAGRGNAVRQFAGIVGLEARIFQVEDAAEHLSDIDILINVAGPFGKTQGPLMDACIATGTHYLDVCGKKKEVETAVERHHRAREAGVVLLPTAGFGVAPPDIAAGVAISSIEVPLQAMTLAATFGGVSRGPLYSVLSEVDESGVAWRNGQYEVAHPAAEAVKKTVFGQEVSGVNNPLRADLLTVPHASRVQHYQSFMKLPGFAVSMMRGKLGWLRRFLLKRLHWLPEGPSAKQMKKGYTPVYAEASNADGRVARVQMKGQEAYVLTAECLLLLSARVAGSETTGGFTTPAQWIGTDIEEVEGVELKIEIE